MGGPHLSAPQTGTLGRCPLHNQFAAGGQSLTGLLASGPRSHQADNHRPQINCFQARLAENPAGCSLALLDQSQQQVLSTYVAVAQSGGCSLGQP